jgi:hypothetical protein
VEQIELITYRNVCKLKLLFSVPKEKKAEKEQTKTNSSFHWPQNRVFIEINFVGISIGIPIENNFEFRRNSWSEVIGISISTIRVEIPLNNRNRTFKILTYLGEKCFEILTLLSKSGNEIGIPISE